MKILSLFLFISFQLFAQESLKQKVIENETVFFGKVKMIYEESYPALYDSVHNLYVFDTTKFNSQITNKFDSITKKYISDTLFSPYHKNKSAIKYDSLKNEYQKISYYKSDSSICYIENNYDFEGRLVRKISRGAYTNENLYYSYDKKGNLIKLFYADAINSKEGIIQEIIYNRKNQIVEEKCFLTSNTVKSFSTIHFSTGADSKVNKETKIKLKWKFTYQYNSNGQLIRQTDYDNYGNIQLIRNFTYLQASQSIDQIVYFEGQMKSQIVSYYDANNRLKEVVRNEINSIERFHATFKYDSHGNRIEEIRNGTFIKEEERWLNEYIYDENDNWITLITKGPNHFMTLTKRRIEYY